MTLCTARAGAAAWRRTSVLLSLSSGRSSRRSSRSIDGGRLRARRRAGRVHGRHGRLGRAWSGSKVAQRHLCRPLWSPDDVGQSRSAVVATGRVRSKFLQTVAESAHRNKCSKSWLRTRPVAASAEWASRLTATSEVGRPCLLPHLGSRSKPSSGRWVYQLALNAQILIFTPTPTALRMASTPPTTLELGLGVG